MEGKRGSECLLKPVPNIDFNPRVTPIYHGNNLVASGIHMEAQSIGSNAIKFNIYIFNVQDGLSINYRIGTAK